MFLILLQYVRPLTAIDHYLDAHNAFLDKYYKSGNFIFSGRKIPRSGGVILCHAENRRAVEKILSDDPFEQNSLAMYDIIEFQPTQCVSGIEQFLE
ncbi:MAG TPA: YciI family protein [Chitinophagaceae bacterium]|jgi:uncharacterized protein YciI|nr:YciI family protein [Chitinophagaceae bacterium]